MFLPQKPEDVAKMKQALASIHEVFKQHVRSKRGEKVQGNEDAIFSGDFFVGRDAIALGLVDKLGSLDAVAKEKFGKDVAVRFIQPRSRFPFLPPWLGGGGAGASSFAACVVDEVLVAVEDRVEERILRGRVGME
jgi:ClpP class serine protease